MTLNLIQKNASLFLFLLLLVTTPVWAENPSQAPDNEDAQKKSKLTAQAEILGGLSTLDGSDNLTGGSIDLLLAPRYKISDSTNFIFLYNGSYYKRHDFYADDDGQVSRTQYMEHNFTPFLSMRLGGNSPYFLYPSFFYVTTSNKDINSSDLEDLYNYQDLGIGLDFMAPRVGITKKNKTLKLGTQIYKRTYPNYESLLYLAVGNPTEKDEKDYTGIMLSGAYKPTQKSDFSWYLNYSLLYKLLDDKKVVDLNGGLTSETQKDLLHYMSIGFLYKFTSDFNVILELNESLYNSNQNYYDDMLTMILQGNEPFANYHNYLSFNIIPKISYTYRPVPITFDVSYIYQKLDYSDRKAKFDDGDYKNDSQWETSNEILFRASYDINKNWRVICQWQNKKANSNNDDERVYRYKYTLNTYSAGVAYKF